MKKDMFIKPEIEIVEILFDEIITCSSLFDPSHIMDTDDDETIEMY